MAVAHKAAAIIATIMFRMRIIRKYAANFAPIASKLCWRALAEIDENLCRAELTAAQRAKFTAARKKAYLMAHPETKKGGDRQTASGKLTAKMANSFVTDTTAKTGKPERTVRRDIPRGERLGSQIDFVTGTSLDKGIELDALAAMPAKQRAPLIQRAASGEEVSAIRSAAAQEPKPGYADLTRSWKAFRTHGCRS